MLGSDLEKLEASISKLTAMLDKSIEYVDDVQSGKIKPDLVVGRELMAAVSAVPEVDCVCVCVCVCVRARARGVCTIKRENMRVGIYKCGYVCVQVSAAEFEESLNKGLHDLLMIHYLGSLTQSQICFWQRMQTMV